MADLAEILSVEHMAIRHIRKSFYLLDDIGPFREFHSYLKESHIVLEEKILVPVLKMVDMPDSGEFRARVDRIMADHRLIQALSENLVKWHEDGDIELFRQRLPLYFRLLSDHNDSEEQAIFPRWREIGRRQAADTIREAASVVESFGMKRYMEVTGISEATYRYLFYR